ncbi:alpha/beta hydrolase [Amycolatopsis sp. NPDC059090]|uniref:alpha/beta hydrolase n=1 Tax=unclassified Amycolatopsis TaxID=2618356 RepID=UPI003670E91F
MTGIDPALLTLLDQVESDFPEQSPESRTQQRARINEMIDRMMVKGSEPAPAVRSITDYAVPVAGGRIEVRVFTPEADGPLPGHLHIHGGAFWLGSAVGLSEDIACRERAAGAGVVVVSVEYRMAPEHQFPGPVEDCYAALEWMHAEHAKLGIDPSRLSVGGASAGGNLAAAVSLLAAERGGPALRLQLLEVPVLDLTGGHLDDAGIEPSDADLPRVRGIYLGDPAQATNRLASPLLADDVTGFPDTHVLTAEFDVLRGDGEAFVRRLQEAGMPATGHRMAGHLHASPMLTRVFPAARLWRTEVIERLRKAHVAG